MTLLVKGGPANSGTKRAKQQQPREPWRCDCPDKLNPRYLASCSTCRRKRP